MSTLNTFQRAAVFCLTFLGSLMCFAQNTPDTFFFHNGRILTVDVIEIGLDEVKYQLPGDDLRMSVERSQVALVKLSDGREYRTANSEWTAELSQAAMSRTQAIKFHFLSPAFNHITFSYERMLRPWTNVDLTCGYIGAGFNTDRLPTSGFLFRGGIKFISRPDMLVRGMRMSHPLHGGYVKPELIFNSFNVRLPGNEWGGLQTDHVRYMNAGLNLVVGKQRFLGDGATLDTWIGVGYALRMDEPSELVHFQQQHQYTHVNWSNSSPLMISAGLSLGVAFGSGSKAKKI